ncbi:DUF3800 domain-containing protein [Actinopolymorpha pittospori]|uniref:DUF3800 domain-containing protein n=1 Tax=Actinopolymorpha pittospori TaxID=648752 RepID=A0A927RNG6_9ACTN|nr:DUF3800 domain-containing protein [Actinopolymorpha pittospori]MBE1610053.1 hypothetical protein [Actinopolymorpha pittospori]
MSTTEVRLFYVDDSGAAATGWVVYSWIECRVDDWRAGLRKWLDLRKQLYAEHHIPPAYELHATKFVNGRGNPSTNTAWNRSKHLRGEVAELALSTIGECGELQVGTVYRHTETRGTAYARQQAEVYRAMVDHLDRRLAATNGLGLLLVDGDGTDPAYQAAHRDLKLATRHVIEDPLFQPAHRSQWIQMADFAAYCAYQSLLRIPAKNFSWDWYEAHLRPCDVNGAHCKSETGGPKRS